MKALAKSLKIEVVFYALLSLFFISPQLLNRFPSLLDDGSDLLYIKSASVADIFITELFVNPRTWPLRLIYRKLLYGLFEINIQFHYFIQGILLFLLTLLTFKLVKKTTKNWWFAFISGLLVFILPGTVGNYYRLGTTEHIQILLILISLLLIEKHTWISLLVLVVNCFFKETSIVFLLIPLIYSLVIRRDRNIALASGVTFILLSAVLLAKLFLLKDAYTSNFGWSFSNVVAAITTSPVMFVSILAVDGYLWKRGIKQLSKLNIIIYLTTAIAFIPIMLWKMNQAYYLLPAQLLSMISLLTVLNYFLIHEKNKMKVFATLAMVFTSISLLYIPESVSIAREYHRTSYADSSLVNYLMNHDWDEYSMYSSITDFEKNHKINLYFMNWASGENKQFIPNMDDWFSQSYQDVEYHNQLTEAAVAEFTTSNASKKVLVSETNGPTSIEGYHIVLCSRSLFIGDVCEYTLTFSNR